MLATNESDSIGSALMSYLKMEVGNSFYVQWFRGHFDDQVSKKNCSRVKIT